MGSAGSVFDDEHLAFYGEAVKEVLMAGHFRPSVTYVGTSGLEFDDRAGILFGYHAGEAELQVKEYLFECPTKTRVILATPNKIGVAGGLAFDVLKSAKLDTRAPIYLVTVAPEPGTESEEQFAEARKIFLGDSIQSKIRDKKLEFHWVTLRRGQKPPVPIEHLVAPLREGETPKEWEDVVAEDKRRGSPQAVDA